MAKDSLTLVTAVFIQNLVSLALCREDKGIPQPRRTRCSQTISILLLIERTPWAQFLQDSRHESKFACIRCRREERCIPLIQMNERGLVFEHLMVDNTGDARARHLRHEDDVDDETDNSSRRRSRQYYQMLLPSARTLACRVQAGSAKLGETRLLSLGSRTRARLIQSRCPHSPIPLLATTRGATRSVSDARDFYWRATWYRETAGVVLI